MKIKKESSCELRVKSQTKNFRSIIKSFIFGALPKHRNQVLILLSPSKINSYLIDPCK